MRAVRALWLAVALGVGATPACKRSSQPHDHASEHAEGHDHHAENHGHGETAVVSLTRWSDRFELYLEHAPAAANQELALLGHLTVLDGFRAPGDAEVELELALDGRPPLRAKGTAVKPGIFRWTVKPDAPGPYKGRIVVRGPVEGAIDGIQVQVHESAAKAKASTRAAEHGSDEIEFLKEQQWGVPFATAFAETGTLVTSIRVSGTIDTPPGGSAEVGAPIAGRLVPLESGLPRPGDSVKKGQTLALLQPVPAAPEDAARASLAVAEAEARAAAAATALERAERLLKDEAIALREVEDARREAALAAEAVRAARRVEGVFTGASAGRGGGAWRLVAPIAGTVVSVSATPGAAASPGQALFRIVDTRELWIRARVPEQDAPRVRADRDARYRVSGVERWATIDVTPPDATASVVSVGRVVDPRSRSVDVIFALGSDDPNLRVGGLVDVSLPAGAEFTGVVVPESALLDQDGRELLYVQVDGEHFVERVVRTGPGDGERIAIVSGVESGERIVTRGAHLVRLSNKRDAAPSHGHVH